uniref:Uncharacterized protein n=1 Tax=Solanum lycopersicum TaxID=4081 RepID=K4D2X8_SOLLC
MLNLTTKEASSQEELIIFQIWMRFLVMIREKFVLVQILYTTNKECFQEILELLYMNIVEKKS